LYRYFADKDYIHLSPGCYLCTSAGYTYCAYGIDGPPPDHSPLWWQEGDDGSKYDRRRDQDYIDLLGLKFDGEAIGSDTSMSWDEWKDRLETMEIGWQKAPDKPDRYMECGRHQFGDSGRIHKYIFE
jgi:hypothetical protein